MIAEWMLYCLMASVGLAVAATLVERVLLAGRDPVRLVWIGAVALSLMIPVAAYRFSTRTVVETETSMPALVPEDVQDVTPLTSNAVTLPPAVSAVPTQTKIIGNWRAWLVRYDQPLLLVWATLSFALACNFLASAIVLRWMRRSWKRHMLQGISVFLSERSGPAVVGTLAPIIVLPKWALSLTATQLDLMLRHEEQHRIARDGQLLTVARLALIVMPWNVALWWQVLRLRVAVELDCDARVLQNADARSYGDLLLEVASTSRGGQLMGATAFAERATQLERRIRVLSRHRVRTTRAAKSVAIGVGVAVLTVAWVAPHPAVPPTTAARHPVSSPSAMAPLASNAMASTAMASTAMASTAATPQKAAPQILSGDTIVTPSGIARADSLIQQSPAAKSENAAKQPVRPNADSSSVITTTVVQTLPRGVALMTAADSAFQQMVREAQDRQADSALAILYDGIPLTTAQQEKARQLVRAQQVRQVAQNQTDQQIRVALGAHRDSTLRSLLSEPDRAVFNSRVTPGARSGGPGPLPDSVTGGGRGGRGRSGGPGGVETPGSAPFGGRGSVNNGSPVTADAAADAVFRRLFNGITLTPAQDSIAHAAIAQHQQALRSVAPPAQYFRMNLLTRVIGVTAPTDSALVAVATTAADREKIRAHLVAVPPQ